MKSLWLGRKKKKKKKSMIQTVKTDWIHSGLHHDVQIYLFCLPSCVTWTQTELQETSSGSDSQRPVVITTRGGRHFTSFHFISFHISFISSGTFPLQWRLHRWGAGRWTPSGTAGRIHDISVWLINRSLIDQHSPRRRRVLEAVEAERCEDPPQQVHAGSSHGNTRTSATCVVPSVILSAALLSF